MEQGDGGRDERHDGHRFQDCAGGRLLAVFKIRLADEGHYKSIPLLAPE
jgi:hypothetical protein